MRNIQILCAGFLATLSVSVIVASTVCAAEWLVDGASITELRSVETIGSLSLLATGEPIIGNVEVSCSQIFDGTISPGGLDEVTGALTTSGEFISTTPLSAPSLLCTNTLKCTSPEVWWVSFPYTSKLESTHIDVNTGTVGFEIKCKGIIGEPSDTCVQTSVESLLEISGSVVLSTTNEAQKANCQVAGALKGSIKSLGASSIQVLEGLGLATS